MTINMRKEWNHGIEGLVTFRCDKQYYKVIPKWVKKEILRHKEIDRMTMNLSPFLITDDVLDHITESLYYNDIDVNDRLVNVWNDLFPMDGEYEPWEFSAAYLEYDELEKYFHIFMDADKFDKHTNASKSSYTLEKYIHKILEIAGKNAKFWIGECTILIDSDKDLDTIPIFGGMRFTKEYNRAYISWVKK